MDNKKIKIEISEKVYKALRDMYDKDYIVSLAKANAKLKEEMRKQFGDTFEEFVDGFILKRIQEQNEMKQFLSDPKSAMEKMSKDINSAIGGIDLSKLGDLGDIFKGIDLFGEDEKKEEPKKEDTSKFKN